MAKFNEYTQKATPEDADTLMIYDDTSKANKLSPFSGIWNWMVGKLTNAVIANLQTNNKTVLGAINELNSKALMHNKVYSTNYDTRNLETIEINLGGTADAAAEILLIDRSRMIFVHAYSADGKTIREIVTKTIYGDNVTPATNNTIISIHVGSWTSGTVIMSYTQKLPSFSIK